MGVAYDVRNERSVNYPLSAPPAIPYPRMCMPYGKCSNSAVAASNGPNLHGTPSLGAKGFSILTGLYDPYQMDHRSGYRGRSGCLVGPEYFVSPIPIGQTGRWSVNRPSTAFKLNLSGGA